MTMMFANYIYDPLAYYAEGDDVENADARSPPRQKAESKINIDA